jgi:hypothetical protein
MWNKRGQFERFLWRIFNHQFSTQRFRSFLCFLVFPNIFSINFDPHILPKWLFRDIQKLSYHSSTSIHAILRLTHSFRLVGNIWKLTKTEKRFCCKTFRPPYTICTSDICLRWESLFEMATFFFLFSNLFHSHQKTKINDTIVFET